MQEEFNPFQAKIQSEAALSHTNPEKHLARFSNRKAILRHDFNFMNSLSTTFLSL